MGRVSYKSQPLDQNGDPIPGSPIGPDQVELVLTGFPPFQNIAVNVKNVPAGKTESFGFLCLGDGSFAEIFTVTDPDVKASLPSVGAGIWNDGGSSWTVATGGVSLGVSIGAA